MTAQYPAEAVYMKSLGQMSKYVLPEVERFQHEFTLSLDYYKQEELSRHNFSQPSLELRLNVQSLEKRM